MIVEYSHAINFSTLVITGTGDTGFPEGSLTLVLSFVSGFLLSDSVLTKTVIFREVYMPPWDHIRMNASGCKALNNNYREFCLHRLQLKTNAGSC